MVGDFTTAHAQRIVFRTEIERHTLALLVVVVRNVLFVLHDAFVVVGVDTINGTSQHLVGEVDIAVRLAEHIAVAGEVGTDGPLEVLVAVDIAFDFKFYTFVGDGRSIVPHLVGQEEVAGQRRLHEERIRVLIIVVELEAQAGVEQVEVKTEVILVALFPSELIVGHESGNESQISEEGVGFSHHTQGQIRLLELLTGASPRGTELTKVHPPEIFQELFFAEHPA